MQLRLRIKPQYFFGTEALSVENFQALEVGIKRLVRLLVLSTY